MRLSQAQFAAAVRAAGNAMGAPNQCTKRLVQKWENGEHSACRSDYLKVLQAVTGLSVRELGFRPSDTEPAADRIPRPRRRAAVAADPAADVVPVADAAVADAAAHTDLAASADPGTPAPDAVSDPSTASSRADDPAAAHGSGDAHTADADSAPGSAPGADSGPGTGLDTDTDTDTDRDGLRRSVPAVFPVGPVDYDTDAMVGDAMSRLRYALEHPSAVDSRTADFVETTTSRLFDLEHHSPARLLTPTVDRHLTTVTALLTAARHANVRRRLMSAAGRTAALAGWLAFDRGDTASANRFWDTSISAAESTLDGPLLACSLTYLSYSAARHGDPDSAWQLAHTASRHTPEDLRAVAWSTSRAALYAAQLGERSASIAAMEQILQIGSQLPPPRPDDGGEPWTRFFDHAALLATVAHIAALVDDPRACAFATEAVGALGPALVKSRALVLAQSALATALAGEFELCLDYGSVAASLTRDLDVSLAEDVLSSVISVLLPHAGARPVRELLPQLRQLSRSSDRERRWARDDEGY